MQIYSVSVPVKADKGWPSSLRFECRHVKWLSEFSGAVEDKKPTKLTNTHNMNFAMHVLKFSLPHFVLKNNSYDILRHWKYLNSFRMDTGMCSGTYRLMSGNINCVPDNAYKNYILHICIVSKLIKHFKNNTNAKHVNIFSVVLVWLKVNNYM